MIIYYHVAVVLVWLNTVVKHLDPDEVAALRNGHIGWGRRRGGGGGGGSANCERPVDNDVHETSGDEYDNVDASAVRDWGTRQKVVNLFQRVGNLFVVPL